MPKTDYFAIVLKKLLHLAQMCRASHTRFLSPTQGFFIFPHKNSSPAHTKLRCLLHQTSVSLIGYFRVSHRILLRLPFAISRPRKRIYKFNLCVYKFNLCVYKTRQDLYTHKLCVEISAARGEVLCGR